ncbi:MAG TPA: HAMP domain-containing sensor histidine kinase [Acidimicrobiia bacterium]
MGGAPEVVDVTMRGRREGRIELAQTYRGVDRRMEEPAWRVRRAAVVVAVAIMLVSSAALALVAADDAQPGHLDLPTLNALLATACAAVAFVAGYVSSLRWRLVGDASSLRGGVALFVLALAIVVTDLVPRVDADLFNGHAAVRVGAALTLTTGFLFVNAVVRPPIDTSLRILHLVGVAVAVFVIAYVLVGAVSALEAFRSWGIRSFRGSDSYALRGGLVAIRVALGIVALGRGLRRESTLWTWFGVMFLGFALSYALRTVTPSANDLWYTDGSVTMLVALLCGLYGVGQELKRAYLQQRSWLFDTRVEAATLAARRRAERADSEERAHQARSAVLALQSATRVLERNQSHLEGLDRQAIGAAVSAEIDLLQRLVDTRAEAETTPFDVAAVARSAALTYELRGLEVCFAVATPTWALGRPGDLLEVLHVLLDNAQQHAPGSTVRLGTNATSTRVELRVEDEGTGISSDKRATLFARAEPEAASSGSGLGLHVARRLMRDQGGDLELEEGDRRIGGTCFVVSLPRPSGANGGARP